MKNRFETFVYIFHPCGCGGAHNFFVNASKKGQRQTEVHLTGPRGGDRTAESNPAARCRAQTGSEDSGPRPRRHAPSGRGRPRRGGAE